MISFISLSEKPALIESDVSVGTGSIGDDEADHHDSHGNSEKRSLLRSQVKACCNNYDEPIITVDCFCNVFHLFLESFCSGEPNDHSSSSDVFCTSDVKSTSNKLKKKPVILNRLSAVKNRHKLDYISLDAGIPNIRLDPEISSSGTKTYFYDSEPMLGIHDASSQDFSEIHSEVESYELYRNGIAQPKSNIPNSNSYLEMKRTDSSLGLINELMNGRLRLRWHPFSSSGPYLGQPLYVKVHAWIEMGYRLKRSIIEPKFSWCSIAITGERRSDTFNFHQPLSVDLTTISRILIPDPIEQKRFPFANLKKSFMIWSIDSQRKEPILFETSSSAERDRIIYGLKLIVSQLISRIMVGDPSVLTDYFSVANRSRRLSLTVPDDKGSADHGNNQDFRNL